MSKNKPTIFCLMGPTASGKTELAIQLASDFPIEIINVDSAQIYQGMPIGTGMPEKTILDKIPHHLINFLLPHLSYNVSQFCNDAYACIQNILQRNHIPLLVGGTMLYFKALQQGLSLLPSSHPEIRQNLEKRKNEEGLSVLYQYLENIDSITAKKLNCNDTQRILRALEVFEMTGKPLSYFLSQEKMIENTYRYINIGLMPLVTPRERLHQRIEDRFYEMLKKGLVEEVEQLIQNKEMNLSKQALRAVGYRQIYYYLQDHDNFESMCLKAIAATRQLAKRQLTWLRSWRDLVSFDFLDPTLKEKVGKML